MSSVTVYWIRNNPEIMNAYVFLYFWMIFFWVIPKLQQVSPLHKEDLFSTFSYKFVTAMWFFGIFIEIKNYIKRYPWNEPSLTIPIF